MSTLTTRLSSKKLRRCGLRVSIASPGLSAALDPHNFVLWMPATTPSIDFTTHIPIPKEAHLGTPSSSSDIVFHETEKGTRFKQNGQTALALSLMTGVWLPPTTVGTHGFKNVELKWLVKTRRWYKTKQSKVSQTS